MDRKTFLKNLLLLGIFPSTPTANALRFMYSKPQIQLLRHATLLLRFGKTRLLIDPMLAEKDALDPVQNCGNNIRIPMVDLPVDKPDLEKLLADVDAVFVTHTHRDHWDTAAHQLINKNKPVFCQPADTEKIRGQGFTDVRAIESATVWQGIRISRTGGRHGTGEIGQKMGVVSGFVFNKGSHSIYVAGDTIWCPEVEEAMNLHHPGVAILNAGGAQFLSGGPITMTAEDVITFCGQYPGVRLVAIHMDVVNHCFVKRDDLKKALSEKKLEGRVHIPKDGEVLKW